MKEKHCIDIRSNDIQPFSTSYDPKVCDCISRKIVKAMEKLLTLITGESQNNM